MSSLKYSQIDLLIELAKERAKNINTVEAKKTLEAIGLIDKDGELTENGKIVWQAINMANKYNTNKG
jgi:hypothetical protein